VVHAAQGGTFLALTHKPVRQANHAECRLVTDIIERIGDKWTVLVVGCLASGTRRYGELQREVEGISQRMLTLTLKQLEADGLVIRTGYPTIPPRVDYALSDLGRTLIVPLQALHAWSVEYRSAMIAARSAHSSKKASPAASRAQKR
jgi:DNA-binding HxlR family transcriptional regulator